MNSKVLIVSIISLCFCAARAEVRMDSPILTATSGTVTASVNIADNTEIVYMDLQLLWSDEIESCTLSKGAVVPTFEDADGGEYWLMDGDDIPFADGELAKLTATLKAGKTCGTVTIGFGMDGAVNASYEPIEIAPITITIVADDYALGINGYSSFSSANPTKVTGATAYYVQVDGEVANLVAVEDNVVPANTGVILKGTEGAIVSFAPNADVTPGENALAASVSGATVEGVHVLATVEGETGFYKYTGTTIGAGKAYLEGVSAARILFDTESAIESVATENNVKAIYNLQGQKLSEAKKGINIVNGKKVLY